MNTTNYQQVYGLHAVKQIFTNDISRIIEIWVQQDRQDIVLSSLIQQAQQQGLRLQWVTKKTLDKLTQNSHHQGIVIRYKASQFAQDLQLEDYIASLTTLPFLLILDQVQDPHNLGACLRSADAAGVHAVITPKDRACSLTPTVCKVASGAADTVPLFQVTNLVNTLNWLKKQGIWLIGTAGESQQSLFDTSLTGAIALILGAEGKGLRRLTRETCDSLIAIPMLGKVESLNVSVATGVCLYEALRQRQKL